VAGPPGPVSAATAPAGLIVPGASVAPRLLAADLRAGSPEAPPGWQALWREEEE
jgi:hypothetical protein